MRKLNGSALGRSGLTRMRPKPPARMGCIRMGEQSLTAGDLWISPAAKIGYLSQDLGEYDRSVAVSEMLGLHNKPYQHYERALLVGLGFGRIDLGKPLCKFSSGELTKLKLAQLMQLIMQECDVLLLDEPTNHLDLTAREEFEKALLQYPGTILLISHDRYLLAKVCRLCWSSKKNNPAVWW